MSAVQRAPAASELRREVATRPVGAGVGRTRLLATPLLVIAAVLVTWWWVSTLQLGTLEASSLTAQRLADLTVAHLDVSLTSTAIVLVTAIPLGIALTRSDEPRVATLAGTAANVGQAATAFGMMVLFLLALDVTADTAAIAGMAVYSFLPVLRGTVVGLQQVDPEVVKAARATGMSRGQVLRQVELPLSVPVILAGVRTALVLNVATTTIAALIGAGGLGLLIVRGFAAGRDTLTVVGVVATAGIAILADWVGAVAEDLLRPKGLR